MKTIILAALVAVSGVTTIASTVNADTFTIHGYEGAHYGR